MKNKVSIILPARNEIYLTKTIQELLTKAKGDIEIIAVLDGYWPEDQKTKHWSTPAIIEDPRVIYLHHGESKGMRQSINHGVAIATGNFILKSDAHCMFKKGFDTVLSENCEKNWVVVPRRFALDAQKWELIKDNPKYPIDYMYLGSDLHGRVWFEKNKDPNLKEKQIDDLMSSQGSCWFMTKDYFHQLELEDELNYGTFNNEFQEIGLKCWLSGGRVVVNKKTWYAHLHKTGGRGYSLDRNQIAKGVGYTKRWLTNTAWHKQTLPFNWLIEKFWPVPTWPEDKNKWTQQ